MRWRWTGSEVRGGYPCDGAFRGDTLVRELKLFALLLDQRGVCFTRSCREGSSGGRGPKEPREGGARQGHVTPGESSPASGGQNGRIWLTGLLRSSLMRAGISLMF